MSDTSRLRTAIAGLVGLAASEEALLLEAAAATAEEGSAAQWAAAPLVAHNTEFKAQQVERLQAVATGTTPPGFAEIDHRSEEVYAGYCEAPLADVGEAHRRTTAALLDGLDAVSDEDLLDPLRHPWLNGRQLGLQVIVRGFWHPMGHVGEYLLTHGEGARALRLHRRAAVTAAFLRAPFHAQGMALYNLACCQARLGLEAEAVSSLGEAIAHNGDLAAKLKSDADLEGLRRSGALEPLLPPEVAEVIEVFPR